MSRSYALTFRPPAGLTYCPVAADWTGSDHGTILFLTAPSDCGGTGYPSIARGYTPEDTPRIEVYYGRRMEELPPGPRCHGPEHVRFLGRARLVCHGARGGMMAVELRGTYTADSDTDAILTLVTTRGRYRQDIRVLRTLAAAAHPCSIPWHDQKGRSRIEGTGARCPARGDIF